MGPPTVHCAAQGSRKSSMVNGCGTRREKSEVVEDEHVVLHERVHADPSCVVAPRLKGRAARFVPKNLPNCLALHEAPGVSK